jgi:N-acetylneuraminic acid mutarotase
LWIATLIGLLSAPAVAVQSTFSWKSLPPLPDAHGFAGPFAGISGGALFVAGGANFPDKKPWDGGSKVWYDSVFLLESPDGSWKKVGKLPRPMAYGVSLTTDDGIACLGGSNADGHNAECYLLKWSDGRLSTTPLPKLPRPCANAAGAVLGSVVYLAGGLEHADDTRTLKTFWSLDLKNLAAGWHELVPWPGPGRMLATVGAQASSVYLFSGADLQRGPDGKPVRRWLKDAYRFTPGRSWQRIADLPRVAVAAPSPAPLLGSQLLLVLGGDDGSQIGLPPSSHRGFRRDVLAYHTGTDRWQSAGELPVALVTTPAVNWQGRIIIPGGEDHPGSRSSQIWAAKVANENP